MADSIPHIDKLARGISLNRDLKSNRKTYKDNYSQNAAIGIRPRRQRWRLLWDEVTLAQAKEIEDYMVGLNQNGTTLTWTPHGQSVELQFEPDGAITSDFENFGVGSVSIDIMQVFA